MSVTLADIEESADPNSGTGAGMIAFLNYLIRKNEMVESTAVALRTGCRKVLDVEGDNWATVDIRTLDVDNIVLRFRNKYRGGDLAERSVDNYEQRFKSTVEMYLKWLAHDPAWRPSTRARNTGKKERSASDSAPATSGAAATTVKALPTAPQVPLPSAVGMVTYPLPLRPGVKVQLVLPEDLTSKEAKRIANFVSALAFDEQLQLEAGPSAHMHDE